MPVNMITKVQTVDKIFHILLNLLGHQCGRIRYNSRDESNGKTHYIHIRTIYMYLYLYIYVCSWIFGCLEIASISNLYIYYGQIVFVQTNIHSR